MSVMTHFMLREFYCNKKNHRHSKDLKQSFHFSLTRKQRSEWGDDLVRSSSLSEVKPRWVTPSPPQQRLLLFVNIQTLPEKLRFKDRQRPGLQATPEFLQSGPWLSRQKSTSPTHRALSQTFFCYLQCLFSSSVLIKNITMSNFILE